MLGPIIWLALAFAFLLLVRVFWVILLQPEHIKSPKPVDFPDTPRVIRWPEGNDSAAPDTESDEVPS